MERGGWWQRLGRGGAGRRRRSAAPWVLAGWLLGVAVGPGLAADAPPTGEAPPVAAQPAQNLAELVPRATGVTERLGKLQTQEQEWRANLVDSAALAARAARGAELAQTLGKLQQTPAAGHDQFADLKLAVRAEEEFLGGLTAQLTEGLHRLDVLRVEWLEEARYWQQAAQGLQTGDTPEELRATVAAASAQADQALVLVAAGAAPLLEAQQQVGALRGRLQEVAAATDEALRGLRDDIFRRTGFPIVSPRFFKQLDPALLVEVQDSLGQIPWPDRRFFASYGWVLLLQVVVAVAVFGAVRRRRQALATSVSWGFLASRPLAVGVFVGFPLLTPLYGSVLPPVWRLLMWVLTAYAVARLVSTRVATPWQRRLLYLLAALFLLIQVLRVVGVPLPLFRLYVLLVSLLGAPICLWRARVNRASGGPLPYVLGLDLGGAVLGLASLAQVAGYSAFATHLVESSIQTTFVILLAWLLTVLGRGALELAFGPISILSRVPLLRKNAAYLCRRLGWIADGLVVLGAAGLVLRVWRIYDTPFGALEALLGLGIAVGGQQLTVGLVLGSGAILYGAVLSSGLLQDLLMEEVYPHSRMEPGVRISMNRLVHYAVVAAGSFFAVGALGVDFQNIAILAGAFSIGIGFGLQNIVNNFVSGLILLFERPIKVNDVVLIDGEWAIIKKLGLRATIVQTYGRLDIIVPNSDLVANKVVNCTLSDRFLRLDVPVGVAYGSDVEATMRVLAEVGHAHPGVRTDPAPEVLFRAFGASSLDFELRVWVDARTIFTIGSDLHQAIDRRFREARIEIAFPQQDLHLRTVDEPARRALGSVLAPGQDLPPAGGPA